MSDDEAVRWDLAVPFVACVSQGGPYDDNSFAAGVEVGMIHEQLKTVSSPHHLVARRMLWRQIDLVAMNAGWITVALEGPDADSEWVELELTKPSAD